MTGTLLQVSAECRFVLQTGGVNVERTFCDGVRLIWGTLNTEHCLHFTMNATCTDSHKFKTPCDLTVLVIVRFEETAQICIPARLKFNKLHK